MAKSAKTTPKSSKKDVELKTRPEKRLVTGEVPVRQGHDEEVTALKLGIAPLDADTSAYFDKCLEKIGFIPNVLRAYAHDLAKLRAFSGLYNDVMLAPSGLSKLEREMIAVVVSAINRCYYCLTAHGAAVRQISGDPVLGELLLMNWRAANLSQRHRAMLAFASKLTEAPQEIEASDRKSLSDAGFSTQDIWDIAATIGFFNMSNRVAAATDMRPNIEYHSQAR